MPKRSSKPMSKAAPDPGEAAFDILRQIIKESEGSEKDPLAVALERRGGLKNA